MIKQGRSLAAGGHVIKQGQSLAAGGHVIFEHRVGHWLLVVM